MKLRHSITSFSITWQGRKLHRRCASRGIIRELHLRPIDKTVQGGKKITIQWHPPESWRVPIHAANELKMAGI
jgi:hypothetical protein